MTNIKSVLILLIPGFLLLGCGGAVNLMTKNWKREVINKKSDDYDLVVKANLSTGCPQSWSCLNKDSICYSNTFTPVIIKDLLDKTSSRIEFVNMGIQKDLKWDVYYYPKKNSPFQSNKDTLLSILSNNIKFSISSDRVMSKVYDIKIIDSNKLMNHQDNRDKSTIRLPKDSIEFYSYSLPSIFKELENNLKITINYNLNDPNLYKMVVPRDNVDNLIAYLDKECGIVFRKKEAKVEMTRVTFKDLK